MTPPAVMSEPRLFRVDAHESSLEDLALTVLAAGDDATCVICGGVLHLVMGGVACDDCGSELVVGEEPAPSAAMWAA